MWCAYIDMSIDIKYLRSECHVSTTNSVTDIQAIEKIQISNKLTKIKINHHENILVLRDKELRELRDCELVRPWSDRKKEIVVNKVVTTKCHEVKSSIHNVLSFVSPNKCT